MAEDEEKPAEAPTPPEPKVIEHKAEVKARATKPASRPKATRKSG